MSGKHLRQRLEDMLTLIAEVESFVAKHDQNSFIRDRQSVRAVERNLEIIGEITRHIPDELKAHHPDIPWQAILGMRNILAHGYDIILEDALWLAACNDLPPLDIAVKDLLKQLD